MNRTQSCRIAQSKQLLELLKTKKKAESQNPSLSPRQKVASTKPSKMQMIKESKNQGMIFQFQTSKNFYINISKTKGQSHIRTLNSERDGNELSIILIHNEKQHVLTIGLEESTTDLYEKLLKKMVIIDPDNWEKTKYFQTFIQNHNIDYYLSLENQSLQVFSNLKMIKLVPVFYDDQFHNQFDDFIIIKCVGVGGFSRVYLVKCKQTGQFYAMKIIDKQQIINQNKENFINNERKIMGSLKSPLLTKLYYSFETKYYLIFIMDYCHGGELFYHLRTLGPLNESAAQQYFVQICLALHYLHEMNVVYRDLKPENILLDIDGYIKLSDFGLSKPNIQKFQSTYSFCGSPEYMSPEMLSKRGHNQVLDYYSLGAVLYELVFGFPPYYDQKIQNIYASIQNETLTFPQHINISDNLKDLLESLLQKDYNNRLGKNNGIAEILSHQWVSGFDYASFFSRSMKLFYKPFPLKPNYNIHEFTKGDREFQQKLQDNMYREKQGKYDKQFPDFDFVNDNTTNYTIEIKQKVKQDVLRSLFKINNQRSKTKALSINTIQQTLHVQRFQSVKNSQLQSSITSFRNSSQTKRFNTEFDLQKLLQSKS